MKSILIVAQAKGHLVMTFKSSLVQFGYSVNLISADVNAISEIDESYNGVLFFADKELLEQQKALNLLKDRITTENTPIFVVGAQESLKEIRGLLPAHLILMEVQRPLRVHIIEVAEQFDGFIKQHGQQKTILVVDDSGAMLRSVRGWLAGKYSVFMANSAAMALKYLAMKRPDLILLDYEMPIVDGKQVLEMIRSESDYIDIPVMFLTGKSDRESVMKVKELKPDGYLLKTMPYEQIVKAVDDFFESSKGIK